MSTRAGVLPRLGQPAVLLLLLGLAVVLFRWNHPAAPAFDPQAPRLVAATIIALLYVLFCAFLALRHRRHARVPMPRGDVGQNTGTNGDAELWVIHASQTGTAQELALRSAETLRAGGLAVRSLPLGELDATRLATCRRALFVVSTTGEGDAPDDAYAFVRDAMQNGASLSQLQYGLLALGDRAYQTFCGFGRTLDHWLREHGATPLFDTVEVDDGDAGALRHWQHQLGAIGGDAGAADWTPPAYGCWRLAQRRVLNAGSPGAPAVWIRIEPADEASVQWLRTPDAWQAGDIAEVLPGPPGSARPHREYSIASLPADGAIELLVREQRHADGTPGLGSGWLCAQATPGVPIALRVRRNPSFHAPVDDRPMILIGNGTGIAGLRAHLKARIAQRRHRNWLLFGERRRAQDFHFGAELEAWLAAGQLARLDLAFSRDAGDGRYVQDLLAGQAQDLREWIEDGATVHVCGSLAGMAPAVDAALAAIIGARSVERLRLEARYRRDVY